MGFEVRPIRAEEREECLKLWCTVWSGDTNAYFRRYFYGDVEWLPYYTCVGVLDDKIVSAVHICKRIVACGGMRLTMGGIANVSTLPEYRGKGYNEACLKMAIAVMESDAMDFSLLFTGIDAYYARQGFSTLPQHTISGKISSDIDPIVSGFQVRKAGTTDVPAIRAIYDDYNMFRPIAVQRDAAYWREWLNISEAHIPDDILIAMNTQNEIVGYVQSGTFNSAEPYNAEGIGERVLEFGLRDGLNDVQKNAAAFALLHGVALGMLAENRVELRLDLALDQHVLSAFDALAIERTTHTDSSGMVRVLNQKNLLRTIAMDANERWIAAGSPTGRLTFATPYGNVALDASGTLLRVEEAEPHEFALSQEKLLGWLFGFSQLNETAANSALFPLIAAVFPASQSGDGVYWGADGF